ncbi:hypothetical protein BDV93DRAFT_512406 [Ceratobasidium sp. AG-I]|nr:hypothetical protein BDV93DRAFT_512406 [Ceratobasidium sp. AG-I]
MALATFNTWLLPGCNLLLKLAREPRYETEEFCASVTSLLKKPWEEAIESTLTVKHCGEPLTGCIRPPLGVSGHPRLTPYELHPGFSPRVLRLCNPDDHPPRHFTRGNTRAAIRVIHFTP